MEKSDVVEKVPVQADVVKAVPDKGTVVMEKPIPSREDVLNETGFVEKVISSTADWFSKERTE